MVNTLIKKGGADPNEKFGKSTCWERAPFWQYGTFAVRCARTIMASGGMTDDAPAMAESRAETFKALASEGVGKRATVLTSKGGAVTARKVVDGSFKAWTTDDTHQQLLTLSPEYKSD